MRSFSPACCKAAIAPYNFVIADRGDERYIGQLDMFRVDWRLRCGELGMVIGSASDRGQGLGREALELMKHFAFRTRVWSGWRWRSIWKTTPRASATRKPAS